MSYDPQPTSEPPVESVSLYTSNIPQPQNLINSVEVAENVSTQAEPLRFAATGEIASLDTSKIDTEERAILRKKVAETVNNYGSAVQTTVDESQ